MFGKCNGFACSCLTSLSLALGRVVFFLLYVECKISITLC